MSVLDRLGRLRPARAALLAGALGALVHVGTLGNDFAGDGLFLTRLDPGIHELSNLPTRLLEPSWPGAPGQEVGAWRPVTTATYALLWAAVGDRPAAFHLFGLLMHGAVTALVVLVLAELMAPLAALAGGLIYAVHPVHSEVVADVPGMAEMWAAIFLLAATLVHVRAGAGYGLGRALAVTGLYAFGVLAKEGAAVLPGLLFVVDAARADLTARRLPGYLRERGPLFALMAAVLATIFVARMGVLGTVATTPPPYGMAILHEVPRVWTVVQGWTHYVRLLLFPLELSVEYGPGLIVPAYGWTPLGATGVLLALAAFGGAWIAWRRGAPLQPSADSERVVGFGVLWVAVGMLPVANVLYLGPIIVAERNLYLPSLGVAAVLGWLLVRLERRRPRMGLALCTVLVVAGAARTAVRMGDWRDTETLSERTLEQHPESGYGWIGFAERLIRDGRVDEGLRAYQIGSGLVGVGYAQALILGNHLNAQGRLESARFFLRRAWRERPDLYQAPTLLSEVERRAGNFEAAAAAARAGTLLRPTNAFAHHLLAQALSPLGRNAEARAARYEALVRGYPDRARQWLYIAEDAVALGDTVSALAALDSVDASTGEEAFRAVARERRASLAR